MTGETEQFDVEKLLQHGQVVILRLRNAMRFEIDDCVEQLVDIHKRLPKTERETLRRRVMVYLRRPLAERVLGAILYEYRGSLPKRREQP